MQCNTALRSCARRFSRSLSDRLTMVTHFPPAMLACAATQGLVEVVASVLAAHAIRIDSDRGEHPLPRQLAAAVRILSREGVRKLDPPGADSEIALVESAHARDLPLQCVDRCGR